MAKAEKFIDAFYSYDRDALTAELGEASGAGLMRFYQGWAEGANYEIVTRAPCEASGPTSVTCDITVEDDLAKTLSFGFDVTDTFTLRFDIDDELSSLSMRSDDPAELRMAFGWTFLNNPELQREGGVCVGFFDDGPTPADCARTVVEAFGEYAALEN